MTNPSLGPNGSKSPIADYSCCKVIYNLDKKVFKDDVDGKKLKSVLSHALTSLGSKIKKTKESWMDFGPLLFVVGKRFKTIWPVEIFILLDLNPLMLTNTEAIKLFTFIDIEYISRNRTVYEPVEIVPLEKDELLSTLANFEYLHRDNCFYSAMNLDAEDIFSYFANNEELRSSYFSGQLISIDETYIEQMNKWGNLLDN